MTHAEQYEEEVFDEEYYVEEEQEDFRSDYERRWWDYTYYEDSRFL
jgi:hypothetical protein